MQMINVWLYWLFSSPGYLLLGLIGVVGYFGLIGGVARSRHSDQSDDPSPYENQRAANSWGSGYEQHYQDWNAHQIREQRRIADKGPSLE